MAMQLAALDVLTTKGRFAPEAARAIGEAMDLQIESSLGTLATKQQLADTTALSSKQLADTAALFKQQLADTAASLNQRITDTAALSSKQLADTAAELNQRINALSERVTETKAELVRWVFIVAMGQLAAMAGMIRYFSPHGP